MVSVDNGYIILFRFGVKWIQNRLENVKSAHGFRYFGQVSKRNLDKFSYYGKVHVHFNELKCVIINIKDQSQKNETSLQCVYRMYKRNEMLFCCLASWSSKCLKGFL